MGGERKPRERTFIGKTIIPPDGQHFSLKQEKVKKLLNDKFLRLKCSKCGAIYYKAENQQELEKYMKDKRNRFKFYDIKSTTIFHGVEIIEECIECNNDNFKVEYLGSPDVYVNSNWTDIPSYVSQSSFRTENSEILLKRAIEVGSFCKDLFVMDFFLGSATTCRVAQKLNLKWIGVEMSATFEDESLPRMKKVLFYDKGGISKEVKEYKGGGFFKYFELEQYEEALANCRYEDSDLFSVPGRSPYQEYVFMKDEKMLRALDIDYENNKVKVSLSELYSGIDIPETLSNLTGKWIRRINGSEVEFEDGTKINTDDPDYKLIKPLIWWE